MGLLDDAIREHLDLKRKHGAPEQEIASKAAEALGPARREAPARVREEPLGGRAEEGRAATAEEPRPGRPRESQPPPPESPPAASPQEPARAEEPPAAVSAEARARAEEPSRAAAPGSPESRVRAGDEPAGVPREPATPQPTDGAALDEPAEREGLPAAGHAEASDLPEPVESEGVFDAEAVGLTGSSEEPEAPPMETEAPPATRTSAFGEPIAAEDDVLEDHVVPPTHVTPVEAGIDSEPGTAPDPGRHVDDEPTRPADRDAEDRVASPAEGPKDSAPEEQSAEEDVLEETPDFLEETPEHDRLWFEQKQPRDFAFDD